VQEIIGVYDSAGNEYIAQPLQALKHTQSRGYYAISGSNIVTKNDEALTLEYYASVPTITGTMTDTNWLLSKHPSLYLYAVAMQAAIYTRDAELVSALTSPLGLEFDAVSGADSAFRYSRARVRVQGVTP
jgi:hypothetical protein